MTQQITPPVVIFKTTSELFKQHYRDGNRQAYLAQILYQEFIEIALRRGSRTIEANENYIRNREKGLGFSERDYNGAKKLLREMNLITSTNRNNKKGKHFFSVIFDPMSAEYQEFLKEKANKTKNLRSDKKDDSEVTICHYKDKDTSSKITTTSTKKNTSNEVLTDCKQSVKYTTLIDPITKKKRYFRTKINTVKESVSSLRSETSNSNSVNPKDLDKSAKIQKITNLSAKSAKIQKKNDLDNMSLDPRNKKSVKPKYTYNVADLRCYNSLVALGATKHREGTKAHCKTMDAIHELIRPAQFRPPYSPAKNISDEYRTKEWTEEEILEVFEFYMKHDSKLLYRNFYSFIFSEQFGEASWSPLVSMHKKMLEHKGNSYEGDAKKLFKGLKKLNCADMFRPIDIKNILRNLDANIGSYTVNSSLIHLYFNDKVYTFIKYVEEMMRNASFQPYYIKSEDFVKRFIRDYSARGILQRAEWRYN